MSEARRWRKIMKRLAYLRAEAADFVDTFEESVKEMEEKLGGKKGGQSSSSIVVPDTSLETSREMTTTKEQAVAESRVESEEASQGQIPDVKTTQESPEKTETKDDVESHYKRLWRSIARLTHPDVAGDDADLLALYKAASSANERRSRGELLDVASELGVQLKDPHPKMIDDASARCSHYESMIKKIGDSIAWQWKHAGESTKAEILDIIKKSRDKKDC